MIRGVLSIFIKLKIKAPSSFEDPRVEDHMPLVVYAPKIFPLADFITVRVLA